MPPNDSTPQAVASRQLPPLRELIRALLQSNAYYSPILTDAGCDRSDTAGIDQLDDFTRRVPFTFKRDMIEDHREHRPYGSNLTFPLATYTRFHQTSGSTGDPMRWLDTAESWQAMLACWQRVFEAAGIGVDESQSDRVYFAFSFGPFLGFWTAFEAAQQMHCLCIPGGGLSSNARLRAMIDNNVDALCCTPTYAIRLGEVAAEQGIDTSKLALRRVIVAGEPGGSMPAVRQHIESLWPTATVFDHHGMTEVGPVTYEDPDRPGVLRVIEDAFLAEVIDRETGEPIEAPTVDAPVGAIWEEDSQANEKAWHDDLPVGELVLTTLRRTGSPLLRYRTGDLVRPIRLASGNPDLALVGGVLGRADDMVLVRGVNIYPSAVDAVIRRSSGVAEYRVRVLTVKAMTELEVQIEPAGDADGAALCRTIGDALREAFNLRIPVVAVEANTLPRFEMKAKRWVRER